ncbi:MAG: sulfotransferase [Verrucomicrobiota bacterium]
MKPIDWRTLLPTRVNIWALNFRRNTYWRIHPARFLPSTDRVEIKDPVFLLGLQGGGLKILSRILRRHPAMISVSGNHRYWCGPDEMQDTLNDILPDGLCDIERNTRDHPFFGTERDGVYATDLLLPEYRQTADDYTPEKGEKFLRALKLVSAMHGRHARFTDKSQLFTICVSLIDRILEGSRPRFVLITRDPYVSCYRFAKYAGPYQALDIPFEEKLTLAAQQWSNSNNAALEDGEKVDRFAWFRFEDFSESPEPFLETLCEEIELDFRPDVMIPRADDMIPLGCGIHAKWYPIRKDTNQKYLDEIEPEHVDVIDAVCGPLAERFNYPKPS